MSGMNSSLLYDATIILYAISLFGYFIDFLQNNRKVNRIAFWLLSIVWVMQTTSLVIRMIQTDRLPILSVVEGLYFYAWVLVTFSLVINRIFRVDFFVFFTNVLGFILMAMYLFAPANHVSNVVAQKLISELLIIHITIAILSYGAFTLSFIVSVMYVLQYNMLKRKKWNNRLRRLGDLSKLEQMGYFFNVAGVPLLLISLILGVIWAFLKIDYFRLTDAKVLGSFFVLAVYSVFLYLRTGKGLHGKPLVTYNLAAFLTLLINFFLFGSLSDFHIWYP